jgi:predicted transcriptional regulator
MALSSLEEDILKAVGDFEPATEPQLREEVEAGAEYGLRPPASTSKTLKKLIEKELVTRISLLEVK